MIRHVPLDYNVILHKPKKIFQYEIIKVKGNQMINSKFKVE